MRPKSPMLRPKSGYMKGHRMEIFSFSLLSTKAAAERAKTVSQFGFFGYDGNVVVGVRGLLEGSMDISSWNRATKGTGMKSSKSPWGIIQRMVRDSLFSG